MTAEELKKEYLSNKRQIKNLKQKIEDEYAKELSAVHGKVKGSSSVFPYSERRFSTTLNDPNEEKARHKRIRDWQEEIRGKQGKVNAVDQLIEGIQNSIDKEIFRYYFLENRSQGEVAKITGYTQGRVSQIIKRYLKD